MSDLCTKEELAQFKNEVIAFFKNHGITNLCLRAQRNYNGNVIIYTSGTMTFTNRRSSFRRTEARRDAEGKIKGWNGTRGRHTTVFKRAIYAYRNEWTTEDKDLLLSQFLYDKKINQGRF